MKKIIPLYPLVLTILCLGLLPAAEAVNPLPDGCYPNYTTAEGCKALQSLTSGAANTGVGWYALYSDAGASFNTGVGAATLVLNNGDSNTAVGAAALFLNTSGTQNTATGVDALVFNDTGSFNTANGTFALANNTTGSNNTGIGVGALRSNVDGNRNNAVGSAALFSHTTGSFNNAIGGLALGADTEGSSNNAFGDSALFSNTTGTGNTANGDFALGHNTNGSGNTAVGLSALSQNTTGSRNIAIGAGAGSNVVGVDDVICIGAEGENISNGCFIGQIFNHSSLNGTAVYVNAMGKLGTVTSSLRFKDDIKSMDKASESIFALRPVSFHYKKDIDPAGMSQFGLVAEEVEKINPDLVVRDKEGKIYSVRYDQVNAMLLNEFLKEHRKVEEQAETIAQLKKTIEAVVAHSKEQDLQIERVRDQVQIKRSDARVAATHQ